MSIHRCGRSRSRLCSARIIRDKRLIEPVTDCDEAVLKDLLRQSIEQRPAIAILLPPAE
jgi:hypothetical protein